MTSEAEFEQAVHLHYASLYRFAFSLTRKQSDASDLTQETFRIWGSKGHQLHDRSKLKSWLFTTLHRQYLRQFRKKPEANIALAEAADEIPEVPPDVTARVDGSLVLEALSRLDHLFQAPIALFYLEDYNYPEIARILEIPLGTVKSRIARGIAQLQRQLLQSEAGLCRKEIRE
jgi:RNA polymerase sigma-70 factor (ECF subfamily)